MLALPFGGAHSNFWANLTYTLLKTRTYSSKLTLPSISTIYLPYFIQNT